MKEYWPAVIAFVCGVLMEFANYLITRAVLSGKGSALAVLPVRTIIAGGFIAALYFIGKAAGTDLTRLMIGGAAGASVGLIVFTAKLLKGKESGANG